jgi:gem associated protein 5
VACGDKTIRLWEPRSDSGAARITLLWKGIGGKVLALAFHPERDSLLAFGTEEGRVGVYDVSAQTYASHAGRHGASVMALSWRRVSGAAPRLCSLAADGALVEWRGELALSATHRDVDAAQERPLAELAVSLSDELRTAGPASDSGSEPGLITDAAWCPAGALLAVGRERGALEVWQPGADGWSCPTRVWAHAKGVTRVRWHPSAQPLGSRRLLSTAADGTLCVFDVSAASSVAQLFSVQAHRRGVQDAAWSPHADATLATASMDGSIRVWDTACVAEEPASSALRSVMRGHDGRALAVCWSAARSDTVFSGSEDQTVRIWQWEHERHAPKPPAAAPAAEEATESGEATEAPVTPAADGDAAAAKQPAASQPRRRRQAAAAKSVLSPATHDAAELLAACASLVRLWCMSLRGLALTSRNLCRRAAHLGFHARPLTRHRGRRCVRCRCRRRMR